MENIQINRLSILIEAKQNLEEYPTKSVELLMNLVRSNPSDLEAYETLIEAFYNNGQISKSKELYLGAKQQYPEHYPFVEIGYKLGFNTPETNNDYSQSQVQNIYNRYEKIASSIDLNKPESQQASSVYNYFKQEILDGNISFSLYINLANHLLSLKPQNQNQIDTSAYCLIKSTEERPFDPRIVDLISKLFPNDSKSKELLHELNKYPDIKNEIDPILDQWDINHSIDSKNAFDNIKSKYPKHPLIDLTNIDFQVENNEENWNQEFHSILEKWSNSMFIEDFYGKIGLAYFTRGELEASINHLEKALSYSENCLWWNTIGEAYKELGHTDKTQECWLYSLNLDPDQSHLYLKLDQLSNKSPVPVINIEDKAITILLYSWNKADLLKETLQSLSKTKIANSKILVLDNNSTDHMQDMLHEAKNLFPNNVFRTIKLPTNVGAPAARNWLMNQTEAKEADYIAYLDDDVELFEGWLEVLVNDLEKSDQFGVAGFKIVNPTPTKSLQYGGQLIGAVNEKNLSLSRKHSGEANYGQLNYHRPCINVMGCCHLFKNKALYQTGEFDIRFSPSQIDDIEHDYQMALNGYLAHYNGNHSITHKQMSGKATLLSDAAKGNVEGNRLKLISKHDTTKMLKLKQETDQVFWSFLSEAKSRVQSQHQLKKSKFTF